MVDDVSVKFGADTSGLDLADDGVRDLTSALAKEAQVIQQVEKANQRLNQELARLKTLHDNGKLSAQQLVAAEVKLRDSFVQTTSAIEKQVMAGQRLVSSGTQVQGRLNLMRQGADVFTTAAMGMNPAMIAIQQGPQILEALSDSGIRLAPAMIAAGSAVAVAAAAVVALGAAYLSGEAASLGYQRAVTGMGATAGLTASQLEELTEAAAEQGEVSEASAAKQAAAYLQTGRIGGEILGDLIRIGKDYASVMGVDADEATRQLARSMSEPDKAARDLTRTMGLFDQETLKTIDSLMKQGDRLAAQKILLEALDEAVAGHSDQVSGITSAWDGAARAVSNYWRRLGEALYTTPDERLANLDRQIVGARNREARGTRLTPGFIAGLESQRAELLRAQAGQRPVNTTQRQENQAAQDRADNADPVRRGRRGPSAESLANKARREAEDRLRDELAAIETAKAAAQDNYAEQMRLQEEKLSRLRGFYGEDAREYLSALTEKTRMERAHLEEVATLALRASQARADAAVETARAETDAERISIETQLALLDEDVAARRLNSVEALQSRQILTAQLIALEESRADEEYRIRRAALAEQLLLEGLKPAQIATINETLAALDAAHVNRLRVARAEANARQVLDAAATATAIQQKWEATVAPIAQSFTSGLTSWAAGMSTFEQAWAQFGQTLLGMVNKWAAEMVTAWLAQEAAKVAATAAGAGARVATEGAAAAATEGISATSALVQIGHKAAVAAAGAYSAIASIPYVGPFLAPVAAMAALAAVLALGSKIFSAERGVGSVGADGDIYSLHKEEMVLPANIARPLRAAIASQTPGFAGAGAPAAAQGAGFGDAHFHFHTLDAKSARSAFRRFGPDMVESLRDQARNFNDRGPQ